MTDDLEFMMLLEAHPDRCEECADGIAHQHSDGSLVACRERCPSCAYCPRSDGNE
jgi:L-lysine 2,3-aminomutase